MDPSTFFISTYRTTYMFPPLFNPAENSTVLSHVHTNPRLFFFFFLRIGVPSSWNQWIRAPKRIFLKPLSEVVKKPVHNYLGEKIRGLKNFRICVEGASKASIFRVSERFSYEKVFVICCISQWMKRSKHALFAWSFSRPKKPYVEKALFNWPIVLQYDVKAKCRLISRKFSGMKFLHPSVRLTSQKPCTFVSVR